MSLEEMPSPRNTSVHWEKLLTWYGVSRRDLPWRRRRGLSRADMIYRVWISEIMLQQTTVAAVVPFYERFLAEFPHVEALAKARESAVLRRWAGLGYYSRARNLRRAAQAIVARGGFPETVEAWRGLPGIGPYTAGAVASLALGLPAPAVDGNVERVLSRVFRIRDSSASRSRIWDRATQVVTEVARGGHSVGTLNQALMELGAKVCRPMSPGCQVCPLERECQARRRGDASRFPAKKTRKALTTIVDPRVAFVRRRQGEESIWVTLNSGAGRLRWLKGFWDLPEAEVLEMPPDFEVATVITHHRIQRKVWIRSGRPLASPPGRWLSLEGALEDSPVALGALAKKSFRKLAQPRRDA